MTINVVIGDRTYRIKIEPPDEEVVRRTLKSINDKIIEYKTQFAGRDMQDYIAMVLLWYATQAVPGAQEGPNRPRFWSPDPDGTAIGQGFIRFSLSSPTNANWTVTSIGAKQHIFSYNPDLNHKSVIVNDFKLRINGQYLS